MMCWCVVGPSVPCAMQRFKSLHRRVLFGLLFSRSESLIWFQNQLSPFVIVYQAKFKISDICFDFTWWRKIRDWEFKNYGRRKSVFSSCRVTVGQRSRVLQSRRSTLSLSIKIWPHKMSQRASVYGRYFYPFLAKFQLE